MKGIVKSFSRKRGFGFIKAEDGVEYFVHFRGILGTTNNRKLVEGEEVRFDVGLWKDKNTGEMRTVAKNVLRKTQEKASALAFKIMAIRDITIEDMVKKIYEEDQPIEILQEAISIVKSEKVYKGKRFKVNNENKQDTGE